MKYWRFGMVLGLLGLVFAFVPSLYAQEQGFERVGSLGHDLGKEVTVVGRTGYIVSESAGMHVFTLRDDYNDQVQVRSVGTGRPVMGVTYRVAGTPTRISGTLYLDTADSMMAPVYPVTGPALPPPPPSLRSQVLLWAPSLICALAALLVLIGALRRWTRQPPPEWGVLTVTSGPDRGLTVPLRRKRIAIGRGVSPARDIRLSSGDQTISNVHVLLEYRHGHLYISDRSSNGTRIGGEKLMPGKSVRVNSGDLIHIGTRGTVIIIRLHAAPPAPGLFGLLREPAPFSDKTIILPEQTVDEPAWKNATVEPGVEEIKPFVAAESSNPPTHLNGHGVPVEEVSTGVEKTPMQMEAHDDATAHPTSEQPVPAATPQDNTETEWSEADDDEEDDIPHTFAPPLVFTFAGHAPKPSRLLENDAEAADDDEGDAPQNAA